MMRRWRKRRTRTASHFSKSRSTRRIWNGSYAASADYARSVRRAGNMLLARQLDGKFAVVNTRRKAFGVAGGCVLAIGGNELDQRQKQRRLRQAIAVDALMARMNPCFLQITERQSLLLVIGDGFLCRRKLRRNTH